MQEKIVKFFKRQFMNFFSMNINDYKNGFTTAKKRNKKFNSKTHNINELRVYITTFPMTLILFMYKFMQVTTQKLLNYKFFNNFYK